MFRLYSLFLLVFVLLSFVPHRGEAQLHFLNSDSLVIVNESAWSDTYSIVVKNITDSTLLFDWKLDIPDELQSYISMDLHDVNHGWSPGILSSCGYNQPNLLGPSDTGYLLLQVIIVNQVVPANLEYLFDSMHLEFLAHPECEILLERIPLSHDISVGLSSYPVKTIHIFPNPVSDMIYLASDEFLGQKYLIYNLQGKMVSSGEIYQNQISTAALESGIYQLCFELNGQFYSQRFLKSQ